MKCISCGAEIGFSPKNGKLNCKYCGSSFDADSYSGNVKGAKKVKNNKKGSKSNYLESKSYTCT